MTIIQAENIVKSFGGTRPVRALDGLDLTVNAGEIFGLLGPNGSGKTTFVKCCLNIIFPTSGRLRIMGHKPGHPAAVRNLGYLPENPNFYDHLSGISFLHYHAELAGIPFTQRGKRVREVLEQVHLESSAGTRRLRTYSKGMLQRIGLAQAIIARPKLIFLDEPQSGLDPIGRRQIKDTMRLAASEGSTILFSSHVLGDVQDVADRVAIIDHGRVRKIAALSELTASTNRISIRLCQGNGALEELDDPGFNEKLYRSLAGCDVADFKFSKGVLVCTLKNLDGVPDLVKSLVDSGFQIYEVQQKRSTLEEVFLQEFGELPLERNQEDQQLAGSTGT